ncbi:oligosaccharide flippase family protein [Marinilactibacillus psychrotolerans]|uniref:Uncharacterized protein n=1 Tax=Marinilactibacillus psychrotolerans TaxID=191770 RepID=A0A5R9C7F7_9LACT|nr:oligosaccharide flippase family protein [Marinilactibacillus psychrotolerans]TLQ09154.1 hypothetical protein FEZ48_01555 [Marinilactibacillus psychrotolerans]
MNVRNTKKDIFMTFLTKLIYLGGSFFISVLLARLLGAEGKGIVTALFVFPNLLISLADMGVRQASAYTIGQKKYTVQEIFSSSLILWILASVLSVVLLIGYYLLSSNTNFSWLLIVIALGFVPIKILESYYYGIHQGKQQIEIMNARHMISFIARLISVVLFVWIISTGVFGAALSMLISSLAVVIYSYVKLKGTLNFKFSYIKGLPITLFKQGILFALALFVLNINYRVDILILEHFVSSTDVGLYSVGVGLAELIWQLPTAIGTVLFSSSANSKSDINAANQAAKLLRVSLVFLVFGSIMFVFTSRWIVPLIYGNEFQDSAQVINLLLPGIILVVIIQVLHSSLSGRGYPLIGLKIFILAIIVNIILNLILIPEIGINGAAIASSVSYAVGGIGYAWIYAKKTHLHIYDLLIIKKEDILLIKNALKKKL